MLTTPDGLAYKILVVPNESDAMTPQLVKRIGELVKAGATVMAPKPKFSELCKQPQADATIRKMAEDIWCWTEFRQPNMPMEKVKPLG